MTRTRQWLLGAGVAAGMLALLAALLLSLVPSDEELAARASAELEAALGVPVRVGALHWRLRPTPTVVIEEVATGQPQPIEIKRLTAHLNTSALWQRRMKVDLAVVQGAVLPQLSLRGLGRKPAAAEAGPAREFTLDEVPMARIEFGDVTWISRHGIRVVYEGEADFDAAWRPRTARLRRPQTSPPADLALARKGQDDRWEVRSHIGGGTADGELLLHTSGQGGLRLTGQLQPRHIEVASALQAFNRRAIIAGKASGETTLSASGATAGELARSLHTTTSFSMGRSTLLRFDLDKAIRSLGQAHAGQTPLDSVTGQIDTQNTPQGMVVTFSRLQARSGAFSASGKARVAELRIQAELAVDLVDGVVGVPLTLSGPLDKVQVSVPASALAGAAAGTAVLPGIGTAIGARIGAAIGKLFGSEPEPAAGPRPAPGKQ
ncbi:AsmA family protein [Polaromonas naphthalenivorans]|uniref:AsmA-like C-terminal domain-containing protein n=1 Tax=Polaromonas naphthalenivorans (strain CJ2) TaxID=365044 RepID=A1VIC2_POLNA|nr:hypothetical protein [Polaromonas naphthalenivorans]ABM35400.1 conserved hypothetical protein [Polaromonas naphthalenivorans CJ2]